MKQKKKYTIESELTKAHKGLNWYAKQIIAKM